MISLACSAGRLARTRMWIMMVFHWVAVNSLGYRSWWQRLQLMAYSVAPERPLVTAGFSGVVCCGPAETIGLFTTQVAPANIARPIANSRGLNETRSFMVFIGLAFLSVSRARRPASRPDGIAAGGLTGNLPCCPRRTDHDNISAFLLHPNCLSLGFSCLIENPERA